MEELPKLENVKEKTFLDFFTDLLETVKSIKGFDKNRSIDTLLKRVGKLESDNKELDKKFLDIFEKYKNDILKEDLKFLVRDDIVIEFEETKLELCTIYGVIMVEHKDFLDTINAFFFFIFRSVCKKEDFAEINDICLEYEENESDDNYSMNDMISTVIQKVASGVDKENLQNKDGTVNFDGISEMVKNLMTDGSLFGDIEKMSKNFGKSGLGAKFLENIKKESDK